MITSDRGFQIGIMLDVTFKRQLENHSCGGIYSGHAVGTLVEGFRPSQAQLDEARTLSFYNCTGFFSDKETGAILRQATALFLLPGNHALYIP